MQAAIHADNQNGMNGNEIEAENIRFPMCPPEDMHNHKSKQPHIRKQEYHKRKEQQPDLPAYACPLRHEQHPVHGAAEPETRLVEALVHLFREGRRVSDFVADGYCHLFFFAGKELVL